jgi:hypothetical protein
MNQRFVTEGRFYSQWTHFLSRILVHYLDFDTTPQAQSQGRKGVLIEAEEQHERHVKPVPAKGLTARQGQQTKMHQTTRIGPEV